MRKITCIMTAVVLILLAAGAPAQTVSGEPLPVIAKYAAEYPEFHSRWVSVIRKKNPDAFLKFLGEESPQVRDKERMLTRPLLDIYVQSGMSPWIAFADKNFPDTPVVPTGKLNLRIKATFSTSTGDAGRTASIAEIAVKPPMPYLMGEVSTGWMPGRTKKGGPRLDGWMDQSVWIKVSDDAEPGPMDLTLFALTDGSQDGQIVQQPQKQEYSVRVVSRPDPTIENVLSLWAYGLKSGQWLLEFSARPESEKKLPRSRIVWVDSLLKEFAADKQVGELVAALREHKEYEGKVLVHFKSAEEKAGESSD